MSGGAPSPSAAAFLGMWVVMTVAMMLPSLAPALWRFRQALGVMHGKQASWLTLVAGAGYFGVWTAAGVAVYLTGVALASAEPALPALMGLVPVAVGVTVLIAGAVQFTEWKASQLARCRTAATPECGAPTSAGTAWRHGLRLGWHCALSCSGPMASLLAIGMMDLRAMIVVTIAITLERLAPTTRRVARLVGLGGVAAGLVLMVRAIG